ncbi:molybdopterin molybdotransferase MoeA [Herbidospora sp. NBRC 101105]|uniref:molybdopterin molybdotransferase MoeA n=1 Tax=Herbidospora sp. NBRC 101105 TaxID=3032195 RepID=UPI0024A0531B|nr:molybdopterin molybdotransferase MoeA [Herbidospora sp. NBRC 101105]GLX95304.1 molybdopterin molybdenumtransferase MoeA [Herbidospora sp. NBRC 101105]
MTVLSHTRPESAAGHADLPWDRARRLAAAATLPLVAAEVPLSSAHGRRLAAALRALVALPGTDVSAMDGYAVGGPGPWHVVGGVLAGGSPFPRELGPGEAVEIATGAPVPAGAVCVVPYEKTEQAGLLVSGHCEPGRHIRRRGENVSEGEVVLTSGALVTPAVLGLAAGLGHDTLWVRPRPVVSVLVTGDEVVGSGVPGAGFVRDAVGPMLSPLIAAADGEALPPRHLPDGAEVLEAALGEPGADVVVVCGASSKGPADHLRGVLGRLGAAVLVDGVAVRPGHPQALARLPGGRLVVGLPGNPFAALAAALTLLLPVLRALDGRPEPEGELSALAGPVRAHPRDTRLVPVWRSARGAIPVGHDQPGSLRGAAMADALAVVPPGWEGGPVELLALPAR